MSFRSNVKPKRFGVGSTKALPWLCAKCGRANREYMSRCAQCGAYPNDEPDAPELELVPSPDDPGEWVHQVKHGQG